MFLPKALGCEDEVACARDHHRSSATSLYWTSSSMSLPVARTKPCCPDAPGSKRPTGRSTGAALPVRRKGGVGDLCTAGVDDAGDVHVPVGVDANVDDPSHLSLLHGNLRLPTIERSPPPFASRAHGWSPPTPTRGSWRP